MLDALCRELNNYFLAHGENDVHIGEYAVVDGVLYQVVNGENVEIDFLQDNQYFRVVGSVFNDGIYKYHDAELQSEFFLGAIWSMSIPTDFIALSTEIEDWTNANKSVLDSPYQSESFGGYSYTKSQLTSSNGSRAITWQLHFADRLNRYRRASIL